MPGKESESDEKHVTGPGAQKTLKFSSQQADVQEIEY